MLRAAAAARQLLNNCTKENRSGARASKAQKRNITEEKRQAIGRGIQAVPGRLPPLATPRPCCTSFFLALDLQPVAFKGLTEPSHHKAQRFDTR